MVPVVDTLLQGSSLGTNQGGIAFCGVTLITGTGADGSVRRILVDPGSSGRRDAVDAALARRGLSGSDIDEVLLTHAHWDHMQNLDPFDRAVILVHPAELNYIKNPHAHDFATPRWTKAVLDCYDVREVSDGAELMPGVTVLAAPGHSAATIAVVIQTADAGTAVVTGDAIQSAEVARQGRKALDFWDEAEANRSVERLVQVADVLYPGHDRPFRISRGGSLEYTEPFDLVITGLAADTAGLAFQPNARFEPLISLP